MNFRIYDFNLNNPKPLVGNLFLTQGLIAIFTSLNSAVVDTTNVPDGTYDMLISAPGFNSVRISPVTCLDGELSVRLVELV